MGAGGFYSATEGASKAGRWCPGDQDLLQPSVPVLRIREARGAAVALGLPPASLLGLHFGRLFWRPREKLSHWTGRCGLLVSGGGRWEKPGEARGREEGGGRREEGSAAALANGKPPTLPKV